jgi:phosphoserine phosphatase
LEFHFKSKVGALPFLLRIRSLFVIRGASALLFRLLGVDVIRCLAVWSLKGESVDDLKSSAILYVMDSHELEPIKQTMALLRRLREDAYDIVLVSASLSFVVEAIAKQMGVNRWFASTLAVKDGKLTGHFDRDLFGKKEKLVEELFSPIDDLIVVTDSKTDLALVRMASKSVLICHTKKAIKFWKSKSLNNFKIIEV